MNIRNIWLFVFSKPVVSRSYLIAFTLVVLLASLFSFGSPGLLLFFRAETGLESKRQEVDPRKGEQRADYSKIIRVETDDALNVADEEPQDLKIYLQQTDGKIIVREEDSLAYHTIESPNIEKFAVYGDTSLILEKNYQKVFVSDGDLEEVEGILYRFDESGPSRITERTNQYDDYIVTFNDMDGMLYAYNIRESSWENLSKLLHLPPLKHFMLYKEDEGIKHSKDIILGWDLYTIYAIYPSTQLEGYKVVISPSMKETILDIAYYQGDNEADGDIVYVLGGCFSLRDSSFKTLKNGGLPNTILSSLQNLQNQTFCKENEFLAAIQESIGEDQINKDLLLTHALTNYGNIQSWSILKNQFTTLFTPNGYRGNTIISARVSQEEEGKSADIFLLTDLALNRYYREKRTQGEPPWKFREIPHHCLDFFLSDYIYLIVSDQEIQVFTRDLEEVGTYNKEKFGKNYYFNGTYLYLKTERGIVQVSVQDNTVQNTLIIPEPQSKSYNTFQPLKLEELQDVFALNDRYLLFVTTHQIYSYDFQRKYYQRLSHKMSQPVFHEEKLYYLEEDILKIISSGVEELAIHTLYENVQTYDVSKNNQIALLITDGQIIHGILSNNNITKYERGEIFVSRPHYQIAFDNLKKLYLNDYELYLFDEQGYQSLNLRNFIPNEYTYYPNNSQCQEVKRFVQESFAMICDEYIHFFKQGQLLKNKTFERKGKAITSTDGNQIVLTSINGNQFTWDILTKDGTLETISQKVLLPFLPNDVSKVFPTEQNLYFHLKNGTLYRFNPYRLTGDYQLDQERTIPSSLTNIVVRDNQTVYGIGDNNCLYDVLKGKCIKENVKDYTFDENRLIILHTDGILRNDSQEYFNGLDVTQLTGRVIRTFQYGNGIYLVKPDGVRFLNLENFTVTSHIPEKKQLKAVSQFSDGFIVQSNDNNFYRYDFRDPTFQQVKSLYRDKTGSETEWIENQNGFLKNTGSQILFIGKDGLTELHNFDPNNILGQFLQDRRDVKNAFVIGDLFYLFGDDFYAIYHTKTLQWLHAQNFSVQSVRYIDENSNDRVDGKIWVAKDNGKFYFEGTQLIPAKSARKVPNEISDFPLPDGFAGLFKNISIELGTIHAVTSTDDIALIVTSRENSNEMIVISFDIRTKSWKQLPETFDASNFRAAYTVGTDVYLFFSGQVMRYRIERDGIVREPAEPLQVNYDHYSFSDYIVFKQNTYQQRGQTYTRYQIYNRDLTHEKDIEIPRLQIDTIENVYYVEPYLYIIGIESNNHKLIAITSDNSLREYTNFRSPKPEYFLFNSALYIFDSGALYKMDKAARTQVHKDLKAFSQGKDDFIFLKNNGAVEDEKGKLWPHYQLSNEIVYYCPFGGNRILLIDQANQAHLYNLSTHKLTDTKNIDPIQTVDRNIYHVQDMRYSNSKEYTYLALHSEEKNSLQFIRTDFDSETINLVSVPIEIDPLSFSASKSLPLMIYSNIIYVPTFQGVKTYSINSGNLINSYSFHKPILIDVLNFIKENDMIYAVTKQGVFPFNPNNLTFTQQPLSLGNKADFVKTFKIGNRHYFIDAQGELYSLSGQEPPESFPDRYPYDKRLGEYFIVSDKRYIYDRTQEKTLLFDENFLEFDNFCLFKDGESNFLINNAGQKSDDNQSNPLENIILNIAFLPSSKWAKELHRNGITAISINNKAKIYEATLVTKRGWFSRSEEIAVFIIKRPDEIIMRRDDFSITSKGSGNLKPGSKNEISYVKFIQQALNTSFKKKKTVWESNITKLSVDFNTSATPMNIPEPPMYDKDYKILSQTMFCDDGQMYDPLTTKSLNQTFQHLYKIDEQWFISAPNSYGYSLFQIRGKTLHEASTFFAPTSSIIIKGLGQADIISSDFPQTFYKSTRYTLDFIKQNMKQLVLKKEGEEGKVYAHNADIDADLIYDFETSLFMACDGKCAELSPKNQYYKITINNNSTVDIVLSNRPDRLECHNNTLWFDALIDVGKDPVSVSGNWYGIITNRERYYLFDIQNLTYQQGFSQLVSNGQNLYAFTRDQAYIIDDGILHSTDIIKKDDIPQLTQTIHFRDTISVEKEQYKRAEYNRVYFYDSEIAFPFELLKTFSLGYKPGIFTYHKEKGLMLAGIDEHADKLFSFHNIFTFQSQKLPKRTHVKYLYSDEGKILYQLQRGGDFYGIDTNDPIEAPSSLKYNTVTIDMDKGQFDNIKNAYQEAPQLYVDDNLSVTKTDIEILKKVVTKDGKHFLFTDRYLYKFSTNRAPEKIMDSQERSISGFKHADSLLGKIIYETADGQFAIHEDESIEAIPDETEAYHIVIDLQNPKQPMFAPKWREISYQVKYNEDYTFSLGQINFSQPLFGLFGFNQACIKYENKLLFSTTSSRNTQYNHSQDIFIYDTASHQLKLQPIVDERVPEIKEIQSFYGTIGVLINGTYQYDDANNTIAGEISPQKLNKLSGFVDLHYDGEHITTPSSDDKRFNVVVFEEEPNYKKLLFNDVHGIRSEAHTLHLFTTQGIFFLDLKKQPNFMDIAKQKDGPSKIQSSEKVDGQIFYESNGEFYTFTQKKPVPIEEKKVPVASVVIGINTLQRELDYNQSTPHIYVERFPSAENRTPMEIEELQKHRGKYSLAIYNPERMVRKDGAWYQYYQQFMFKFDKKSADWRKISDEQLVKDVYVSSFFPVPDTASTSQEQRFVLLFKDKPGKYEWTWGKSELQSYDDTEEYIPTHIYITDEGIASPQKYFKLTEQSFTRRRIAGISKTVIRKLRELLNQEFSTKKEFLKAIEKTVGKSEYNEHILQHLINPVLYIHSIPVNNVEDFLPQNLFIDDSEILSISSDTGIYNVKEVVFQNKLDEKPILDQQGKKRIENVIVVKTKEGTCSFNAQKEQAQRKAAKLFPYHTTIITAGKVAGSIQSAFPGTFIIDEIDIKDDQQKLLYDGLFAFDLLSRFSIDHIRHGADVYTYDGNRVWSQQTYTSRIPHLQIANTTLPRKFFHIINGQLKQNRQKLLPRLRGHDMFITIDDSYYFFQASQPEYSPMFQYNFAPDAQEFLNHQFIFDIAENLLKTDDVYRLNEWGIFNQDTFVYKPEENEQIQKHIFNSQQFFSSIEEDAIDWIQTNKNKIVSYAPTSYEFSDYKWLWTIAYDSQTQYHLTFTNRFDPELSRHYSQHEFGYYFDDDLIKDVYISENKMFLLTFDNKTLHYLHKSEQPEDMKEDSGERFYDETVTILKPGSRFRIVSNAFKYDIDNQEIGIAVEKR